MGRGIVRFVLSALALTLATLGSAQVDMIVRLKNRIDANLIGRKYGIQLVDRTPGAPFVLYRAKTEAYADAVEAKMLIDPAIEWVEEDDEYSTPEEQAAIKGSPYKGTIIPAVGDRFTLYKGNANALNQINFSASMAAESGRAVRVAVLDSGLSPAHPYLWNKVDYSVNFVEPGFPAHDVERGLDTNGDGVKDGSVGHGTMVAGVIDQLAPNSRFTIVRLADSDGISTAWWLIKGLAYAVVTGCEIANVSLGSQNDLPAMSDVMDWCEEKNLLVVAAAGNNGADRLAYPGRISKVVAVGGLNPDNTKASFANYDSHCDFSAPATGIISQWYDGRIGEWTGTSFSTPMVTGAIADALKGTGKLTPLQIRTKIENAGRNIDSLNERYDGEIGLLLDFRKIRLALRGKLVP